MSHPADQPVLWAGRSDPSWVVVSVWRVFVVLGIVGVLWWFAIAYSNVIPPTAAWWGWLILIVIGCWVVCVAGLRMLVRRFTVSRTEVRAEWGILHRSSAVILMRSVRAIGIDQSLLERVCGIGSIGIASAGTGQYEVVMVGVRNPAEIAALIRTHAESFAELPSESGSVVAAEENAESHRERTRPLVIGLAGSIAAGKSVAARMLHDLGCIVVDSDANTREVLDTPEVIATLSKWWGDAVLTEDGGIDRKAVGAIVFADHAQRRRLEALVHPMLGQQRDRVIADAPNDAVVVLDAPLLFEVGLDASCDATVYIDAPRPMRLERVASRDWDARELDRREASQMPIAEKKAKADVVIENDGSLDGLREQLSDLIANRFA